MQRDPILHPLLHPQSFTITLAADMNIPTSFCFPLAGSQLAEGAQECGCSHNSDDEVDDNKE